MKRKLPPKRMLNSLRCAQKQFELSVRRREFVIRQLSDMRDHFTTTHPAHMILEFMIQEEKHPYMKYSRSSPDFAKAQEELLGLQCLCPTVDMDSYDLKQIEKELNFSPAPSRLPEIYFQMLDNPYSVFVDLIFSGEDLALTLPNFPLKKDSELQDNLGDEESINLAHHLPLSNAIFLTHFDLNRFCKEVTQEKFNSRMNLKEFGEFEQKFVYRKESALEYGVINSAASRFGFQIFMIQEVLKHTQAMLDILLRRYINYYRCSGGFYPRFFSDRPTMMFYPS